MKVWVTMQIPGEEIREIEVKVNKKNLDFLWGSITAQCEDVDSYAQEVSDISDPPSVTPETFRVYAGYRSCVRNRWTGASIAVVDGVGAGWETDIRSGGQHGARWYSSCETHHHHVSHRTLRLARHHAATPEEWCDECRKIYERSPLARRSK